jgi:CRP-like cAMP-binding protein
MDLKTALLELALFQIVPEEAIDQMVQRAEIKYLDAGTRLFSLGDPSDALYVIKQGHVKIVLDEPDGSERILNQIGPGIGIGQITVISGDPRTAGMVTLEPTDVYMLHRDDILDILQGLPDNLVPQLREIAARLALGYLDILKRIPIFSALSHEALIEIAGRLEPVAYEAGETLFYEGDEGDALYIIEKGRVKITTRDASGKELVLNEIGAGETVGELALIDRAPRSATVAAIEPARLLRLGRDDFLEEIRNYPEIALDIMRLFSQRIRFASSYLERIVDASREIAAGNYDQVKQELAAPPDDGSSRDRADRQLIDNLLTAFVGMIEEVQHREQELKEQVQKLTIQIDQARRQEEVESITKSDFFADLKEAAKKLREENED